MFKEQKCLVKRSCEHEIIYLYLSVFQSPRNGDDLSDGEPMENEERSHTPPPRMDSPEDNLTPQLKVKVNGMKFYDKY